MPEPSPRPWRVEMCATSGYYIVRADGVSIGKAWKEEDARLIVDAVNAYAELSNADFRREMVLKRSNIVVELEKTKMDRDELRDLVRRLLVIREYVHATDKSFLPAPDPHEVEALLQEARAAIGEAGHA